MMNSNYNDTKKDPVHSLRKLLNEAIDRQDNPLILSCSAEIDRVQIALWRASLAKAAS